MSLTKLFEFYLWQYAGDLPQPIILWWQKKNVKILLGKASQLYTYHTLWSAQQNWGGLPIIDKTLLRQGCLIKDRSPDSCFVRYVCDRKGQPFCLQEDFNFLKHKIFLSKRSKKKPEDFYFIPEFGPIAERCQGDREGFHVYNQSMILEITDNSGRCVEDGTMGRTIVTYFLNHYMPFIRYDTGEQGLYCKKRCACGKKIFVPEPQKYCSININGRIFNQLNFDRIFCFYYLFISRYEVIGYEAGTLKIAIEPGIFWKDSLLGDITREISELTDHPPDRLAISLVRADKSR